MATLTDRAGEVYLRVGGNTQEFASVIDTALPHNDAIDKIGVSNDSVRAFFSSNVKTAC